MRVTGLLKASKYVTFWGKAPHLIYITAGKIPNWVTMSSSSILLSSHNPVLHILSVSISSCPSVPLLLFFSSFVSHLLFPIHSSQPPNRLIIISSPSLHLPLSPPADWQCGHAEVNWDVATVTAPLYWFRPTLHFLATGDVGTSWLAHWARSQSARVSLLHCNLPCNCFVSGQTGLKRESDNKQNKARAGANSYSGFVSQWVSCYS